MRALWIGYPTDERATRTDDQYLWGDSFLVAPVHENGATQRATYLPDGAWWDYWSGERLQGGREVSRSVDLATMPVYVKAGSIVPVGPVKQHTAEVSDEPVTLRIYPGADGKFTWYDDDGSSFLYEKGEYMKVACVWRDNERVLSLARDPKGRLGAGRKMNIVVQGETHVRSATLGAGVTEFHL
jgi:alpha-glucosidase/alpha-D-xyloside xylohydrolase